MSDRYGVVGHPIAHSQSPRIHAAFARATGEAIEYVALEGSPELFESQLLAWWQSGFRGLNITLPFKERALAAAARASERARLAGAANTLALMPDGIVADNTDGVGLMRDLDMRLQVPLRGRRLLILGAGGAVRGILAPLLAVQPAALHLSNRTPARAEALVQAFAAHAQAAGCDLALRQDTDAPYDVVINGTSASLGGEVPTLTGQVFARDGFAYDLAYRLDGPTAFLCAAARAGAAHCADGLGMLVEQAAESFAVWRGVRPETGPVLRMLREPRAAQ